MAMAMTADSSSGNVTLKYDVFLSFSGVDTRKGFTNTLFDSLKSKGIDTFIDDGLPKGQQIETSLFNTIKESMIAVVVFSKNYASSSWCLNELVKMREFNLVIMPIFYDVKPDHVRELSGEFGKEFSKLKSTENVDKIKKWSDDLAFAATQSGWDLNNCSTEIGLIKEVAAKILKYLDSVFVPTSSGEFSHYIGIASLVDDLKRLLNNESSGVQFCGLWGMGGIGKTTIAEVLYHQLSPQFDRSYFCSLALDVKDDRKVVDLRNRMISHILEETYNEGTPNQPCGRVVLRLRKMKVLIVLDNVSTNDQVKTLVGSKANPWFAFGSKVIVTSRDTQVLKNEDMELREIKEMSRDFSLRLFCLHAFKQSQLLNDEDYIQFSNRMVDYTNGLPLALKVLGRDLYERTKDYWRSSLETLETRMDPLDPQIEKVLMISYDSLRETEKERFLDIACFFNGYDKDCVKDILGEIMHLIDKCLVTVNHDKRLQMHDLLQKMGQDIVEKQSGSCMRKRGWRSFDGYNLLKNYQEASKAIEGIFIDMDDDGIEKLKIHPMTFSKMQNLKFLFLRQSWGTKFKIKIQKNLIRRNRGIQFLPKKLRVLHWDFYPGEFLPSGFVAENLVVLEMLHSKLRRLWKEAKISGNLGSLTVLDLSYSSYFTTLPVLTSAPKLEKIILDGCQNLREIPASIQDLQSLSILSLFYCYRLCDLPNLANIGTLRKLNLDRCLGLTVFPETSKEIEVLILWDTSIVQWPDSMSHLSNLKVLKLPSKLQKLPRILQLNSLKELIFADCDIQVLPEIVLLSSLIELRLSNCRVLDTLPSNFGQLNCLEARRLSGCEEFLIGPLPLSGLNSIKELYLYDCRAKEFPSWVCTLSSLQWLDLSNNDFVCVPDSIKQLSLLKYLKFHRCRYLRSLPEELPRLTISSDVADGGLLEPDKVGLRFCFTDCGRLDEGARRNLVEKTMMRIQHVANRKDEALVCPLTVSLPGNEIPEFFEDRYEFFEDRYASCATLELSIDLSSSTFRGLVIGVIACGFCEMVDSECTARMSDYSLLFSSVGDIKIDGFFCTDTLCLHYLPSGVIRKYCKYNLKDATNANYRFVGYLSSKVRKCGVRLVYAGHEV